MGQLSNGRLNLPTASYGLVLTPVVVGSEEIVDAARPHARDAARELAAKEGIFCGISSGGTFAGAKKMAEKAPRGDGAPRECSPTRERYLSTTLPEGMNEGSNEEPSAALP